MYGFLILFHILGATIWTGGHLILALAILPKVLREKSAGQLAWFESAYERIGIPALLIQTATGLTLAYQMIPNVSEWFAFQDPISSLIGIKLILLAITIALAIDARLRIIPKLTEKDLPAMAWHIIPVTVVSVLFVCIGAYFRAGWLS
ncbi:MAG TPA: copper resistance protein CopD [Spongiibacteraceae bacterium]|nr:copper resistance protein CopD [Spongiibacteraceae bacterium]